MPKVSLKYNLDLRGPSAWMTVTPGAWARQSLVYVQELGDFPAQARYFTEREGLDSLLLKYTLDGEGYLEYGGQRCAVGPGSVFWIDCAQYQHYGTSPEAGHWHVLWVHFTGGNSRYYYEQYMKLNGGSPVREMGPENHISQWLRGLMALYGEGQSSVAADARASALLTEVMAECVAGYGAEADDVPACVRQAQNYLNEHYAGRVTLEMLGKRYALDKFYFQKLFKRHVGISPSEYLLLARLTQAKRMLRETNMPIAQVAQMAGMGSASHFIRQFRQHEHITPGVYRQNWHS